MITLLLFGLLGLAVEISAGVFLYRTIRYKIAMNVIDIVWKALGNMKPGARVALIRQILSKWCPLCGERVEFDKECPHHPLEHVECTDEGLN